MKCDRSMKLAMFKMGGNSSRRESNSRMSSTNDNNMSNKKSVRREQVRKNDRIKGTTGETDSNAVVGMMDEVAYIDGKKANKYWARIKEQRDDHNMTYVDANTAAEYWQRLKSSSLGGSDRSLHVPIEEISFSVTVQ